MARVAIALLCSNMSVISRSNSIGIKVKSKPTKLARHSHVSMYQQIANHIFQRIARGELKNGDRLPTEPELMEQFGVSRITVRLGVADLVDRGVLLRQQGKGTFVRSAPISHDVSSIHRLIDQMHVEDGELELEFLDAQYFDANHAVRTVFGIHDRELLRVRRFINRAGRRIGVTNVYFPFEMDTTDQNFFRNTWGYDLIERHQKKTVETTHLRISCIQPPPAIAELLRVSSKTQTLLLERISRDRLEAPLEYMRLYALADEYQVSLTLTKTEYESAVMRGKATATSSRKKARLKPKQP